MRVLCQKGHGAKQGKIYIAQKTTFCASTELRRKPTARKISTFFNLCSSRELVGIHEFKLLVDAKRGIGDCLSLFWRRRRDLRLSLRSKKTQAFSVPGGTRSIPCTTTKKSNTAKAVLDFLAQKTRFELVPPVKMLLP